MSLHSFKTLLLVALALATLSGCKREAATSETTAAPPAADVVLTGGKVYTLDEHQPWAEAVAVKDNKIVYVGDAAGAKRFVGESTEVIDTTGKTVLPGFVSAHDHLIASTWALEGLDLGAAKSIDEALQMVKEYADANPDAPFIRGVGWSLGNFGGTYPTRQQLDRVVPDRPAFLLDFTIHDAWLNTAALEAGGVTKASKDVQPGTIYWLREKNGYPTGIAIEFQWLGPFIKAGAWQPEETFRKSSAELLGIAAKNGTTTVQVTGLVTPTFKEAKPMQHDFRIAMKVLTEKKNEGDLPLRIFAMPIFKDATGDIDDFVAFAKEMSAQHDDDLLRVQSIKIHPEGNYTAYGAPFLEPYADRDTSGHFGVKPEQSKEIVTKANQAGLNAIIHTDGDASARAAIDAFVASTKAGFGNELNALHHLIWVHPDDYQRIVELKIPVNSTPSFSTDWASQDESAYRQLGKERTELEMGRYPDLIRAGNRVSISADVPSTLPSMQGPLFVMEAATTMREPSEQGVSKPFPRTRKGITIEQALRAVTIDAAWQLKMEDKIGSLEVGKLADIVVLAENPLETDPLQLAEIKVLGTMMDGRFTHREGI